MKFPISKTTRTIGILLFVDANITFVLLALLPANNVIDFILFTLFGTLLFNLIWEYHADYRRDKKATTPAPNTQSLP